MLELGFEILLICFKVCKPVNIEGQRQKQRATIKNFIDDLRFYVADYLKILNILKSNVIVNLTKEAGE